MKYCFESKALQIFELEYLKKTYIARFIIEQVILSEFNSVGKFIYIFLIKHLIVAEHEENKRRKERSFMMSNNTIIKIFK